MTDFSAILRKTYSTVSTAFAGAVVGFDHLLDIQMLSGLDQTGAGALALFVLFGAAVAAWDLVQFYADEF